MTERANGDRQPPAPAPRPTSGRPRIEAGFWAKVRKTMGRVPFVEEAVAAYYCTIDKDTPPWVKVVLAGALAYFVMPADMIPDFIAGFGFTDDAAVFYAALRAVSGHVTDRHRERARAALNPERSQTGTG